MQDKIRTHHTITRIYNKNSLLPLNNGMFDRPLELYHKEGNKGKLRISKPIDKRCEKGHA